MIRRLLASAVLLAFPHMSQAADPFTDPLTQLDGSKWHLADGWQNGFPFLGSWLGSSVTYSGEGMAIEVTANNDGVVTAGEFRSNDFYSYGCFEVEMKPVAADGVVSSFFLFAGPHDQPEDGNGRHNEIDIEFLGMNTNMVQLNFWSNDDEYVNGHEHLVYLDFDASEDFHHYAMKWTKKSISWYIDGEMVYRVSNSILDPTPSKNDTKLRIMMNVWATDPAISNWAGEFDHTQAQSHTAFYRNFSYTESSRCQIITSN